MGRHDVKKLAGAVSVVLLVPFFTFAIVSFIDILDGPVRNAASLDAMLIYLLMMLVLAPPALLSSKSESSDESDKGDEGKVTQIVSLLIQLEERIVVIFIAIFITFFILQFPDLPQDDYSGGEISCHVLNPTYKNNIQEVEVIEFSSLNEMDKRIFRMVINDSYLKSVRNDLNETEEYDLLVTKDAGYDEVNIIRG